MSRYTSRYTSHLYQLGSAFLCSLLVCSSAQADNAVMANVHASGMSFATSADHSAAALTVSGPGGYYQQTRETSAASLSVDGILADGIYNYEVTLEPTARRERREGDEMSMQDKHTGSISSGSFRVVNGAIVNPNIQE